MEQDTQAAATSGDDEERLPGVCLTSTPSEILEAAKVYAARGKDDEKQHAFVLAAAHQIGEQFVAHGSTGTGISPRMFNEFIQHVQTLPLLPGLKNGALLVYVDFMTREQRSSLEFGWWMQLLSRLDGRDPESAASASASILMRLMEAYPELFTPQIAARVVAHLGAYARDLTLDALIGKFVSRAEFIFESAETFVPVAAASTFYHVRHTLVKMFMWHSGIQAPGDAICIALLIHKDACADRDDISGKVLLRILHGVCERRRFAFDPWSIGRLGLALLPYMGSPDEENEILADGDALMVDLVEFA